MLMESKHEELGLQVLWGKCLTSIHGCLHSGIDALNCSTGSVLQAASIAMGFTFESNYIIGVATWVFFISTWETYYTGTLYLGYINGPTEGLLMAIASMFFTGVYGIYHNYQGPGVWRLPLQDLSLVPSFLPSFVMEQTLATAVLSGIFFLMITSQAPVSIYRGLSACRNRKLSVTKALLRIVPFIVLLSSFMVFGSNLELIKFGFSLYLAYGIAVGRICVFY
jgi:ethanolaminephosphotransferase